MGMESKECTRCKDIKPLSGFNKNKSKKDGHHNLCRVCSNANSKKYYKSNKDEHIRKVRIITTKTRKDNQKRLFEYYANHPCVDCGNDNPIVLELDHRDGVDKFKNVSRLIGNAYSWSTILKEIDKCDVRCANCHRIRTAKQLGWYKGLI